jgi:coproporphyrinogen III oxidase-like Fe-S oxidoreductase
VIHHFVGSRCRKEFSAAMRFDEELPSFPHAGPEKYPRLLYLHVPFCEKLCPYCSFNRVPFDEGLCRSYFQALRKEIHLYREMNYNFESIYVGGGTPTVLIEELIETLQTARDCFHIREISVETNPNHLTEEKVLLLQGANVNRLSVGVQSFNDELLKKVDRYEKYGSGKSIARRLKELQGYFDTLNVDMIFNFPGQDMKMLRQDLDILREIDIDQITFYPLMVSDVTRTKMTEALGGTKGHREKKFYQTIIRTLLPAYRFSSAWCFSKVRTGNMIDEYIVNYDEYAGLGSGSIGYLNGICYANTFHIPAYIERLNKGELPVMAARAFSLRDRVRYDFLMRLFGGTLNLKELEEKYRGQLYKNLWLDIVLFSLIGSIRYMRDDYRLTYGGRYIWVVMMREFFTAVNNFRDFCRKQAAE